MDVQSLVAILMVVSTVALLMAGYPVALTLAGVALAFVALGDLFGVMTPSLLGALPQRIFGVMTNEVLLAIPLFVFMGVMLERSRVAEDLLEALGRLLGRLHGGLAVAVVIVGVLLAAAKGIVGATTVTMGLIVLPTMLRHGYDKRLAAGTVAATATLAQIFPPATVLVLLGDQMSNAYQAAQLAQGNFAPQSVTVSDLFAGAILPAFGLVVLYIVFLVGIAVVAPTSSPAIPPDPSAPHGLALVRRALAVLVAPILLIVAVLGSILGGLATPTEAAAVGAFGAMLLAARPDPRAWGAWLALVAAAVALLRLLSSHGYDPRALVTGEVGALLPAALLVAAGALLLQPVLRVHRQGFLVPVLSRTAEVTSMIFLILIGATLFSLVFRGLGGDDLVHRALSDLPGGTAGAVLTVMLAIFLLGFVMDAFEIIFVVVPIVGPALLRLPGVDPVWLAVMIALNLQTSYIHPPLGPTLFFLRGVAPKEISTADIYVGAIPFVLIQLLALLCLWFVPAVATWLPGVLYGG
ncbi:TRAP transporter large permease [Rhodoplanes roseus]|uniref:Tripartite transporter n=1 Tax=Rhodoplanes roseus TaxID=29409 RepID=A0A327KXS5_9BRAD|nr:TRAP transporter large permease subunit [Rhodoplanes roseus]RAI42854.1 tripartite transporter [Rhodoplanes roseus]